MNARFVKPMDTDMLHKLAETHKMFVTIEEGIANGGYGQSVSQFVYQKGLEVKVLVNAIQDQYVEQGSIGQLRKQIKLDADSIVEKIESIRR